MRDWLDRLLIRLHLVEPYVAPPPKRPVELWLMISHQGGVDYWPGGRFIVHHSDVERIEVQQVGAREIAACYKAWYYYKHVMKSPDDVSRPADLDLPPPSAGPR